MPTKLPVIGVFCSDLGGYYYGAMLTGIHRVAQKVGVPLVVIQQALREHQLPAFGADYVAGWIILHPRAEEHANLATLCSSGVPVVTVPVPLPGIDCTLVQVDNRGGMAMAVSHLIEHGHQRIAYVDHGPEDWSQQRYLGYCDALSQHKIPLDPALVIRMEPDRPEGVEVHHERGEHAARYLLKQEVPCTALALGTDTSAIAAMQVLQAAGRRIPEDVAVVGFDDIVRAQYANPPLTTVNSDFDAIGRTAAEQLLAEIHGETAAYQRVISVPTTLSQRRSCGCVTLDNRLSAHGTGQADSDDWQALLVQQLVHIVHYPLPPDPHVLADQVWPGARVLVGAIDAVLHGQHTPSANIQLAWQEAVALTRNVESLHVALTLLEEAAEQHLADTPDALRPTVAGLLRQMRLEMMRARLDYETAPKRQLLEQVRTTYAVSMALLGSTVDEAQTLDWLANTPATWGCLGLWDGQQHNGAGSLTVAGVWDRNATSASVIGQQMHATAFPPLAYLPNSAQRGQEVTILCPIYTATSYWGVLALCGWADQSLSTSDENLSIQATMLGATLDRNAVLTALTTQQETLHDAYNRERMLSQTIRDLGCPIIPLLPHVLLVPLIGAIDSQRAQQIISTVLVAISEQRAQTVLLDVTGVPIVDTQVANSLIQTAQAATLLGAQVVMVGIRPEIAQSIVSLGIDLRHLTIYATLARAISMLRIQ